MTASSQPTSPSVDGETLQLKAWKNGRREPCTMQEFIDQIRTFGEFAIKQGSIESCCPNSVHMGEMLIMAAAALSAPRAEAPVTWEEAVECFVNDLSPNSQLFELNGNIEAQWHVQGQEWFTLNFTAAFERLRPLYAHPAPPDTVREAADEIIGQIEARFPNWKSYRDLVDCIDCTLHALRGAR